MARSLMAILVADIVGFSTLMQHDDEGTLDRINALKSASIDPVLHRHNGRIFKTTGDGFLAAFHSAVEAVQCAIDIQEELKERATSTNQAHPIVLRIGVNVGDVVSQDDDIFGDGVNVAARLEALADPGGVCISGAAFEQVKHRIDTPIDDLGHKTLKNIAQPVHVFRVRFDDSAPVLSNMLMFDVGQMVVDQAALTTGGCLCGAVRYEINQPSIGAGICHCRFCQKSIGAPANAWVAYPATATRFTRGQPKWFQSSAIAERGFCSTCGTSLTYRVILPEDCGYLAMPIVTLDDPESVSPSWHGGIESQLTWLEIQDELPRARCRESPSLQKAWAAAGCENPDDWTPDRS